MRVNLEKCSAMGSACLIWTALGLSGLVLPGCGGGGERAAAVAPDPGVNAEAGASMPTGDVNRQKKK
jgi:hypothetical protein